jgi:single-strand DNA-binding protein
MNRWTGTGHLTKDPKFLESNGGTAICALRIAVKRAGRQGNDGYFDVKCFDGQAHACADYLKAGREVAIDGRLLFDEFQTQDGSYASRVYVVAERVEFPASAARARAADNGPTGRQAGRAGRRRGWRRDRLLAGGRAIEIRRKRGAAVGGPTDAVVPIAWIRHRSREVADCLCEAVAAASPGRCLTACHGAVPESSVAAKTRAGV